MSKPSARKPIPPRPQLIPEQLRTNLAGAPKVLNRQQCAEFMVGLASNLANMLNNRAQLPWVTATIDKRSDGFSLHVQLLPIDTDSDAR